MMIARVAVFVLALSASAAAQMPDIIGSGGTAKPAASGSVVKPQASPSATSSQTAPASGQTPSNPAQPASVDDTMPVATSGDIKVSGTSPTDRVKARFADAVRADSDVRDKTALNGSIRYEDAPPQKAGEVRKRAIVTWTSVSREDGVAKRETLPVPLISSFTTGDQSVSQGTVVTARGDVAKALATAKALLAEAAKTEQQKATPTTGQSQTPQDSGRKPVSAAGDGPSQNGILRSLSTTPAGSSTSSDSTAAAPADVYGETSDGCTPKIDLQQGVAIVQTKTTKNGSATGECTESLTRYPIQKGYSVCTDKVDTTARKAYAQYKLYYVSGAGSTTYVSEECVIDTETAYDFSDDYAACSVDADLIDLKAYRRAETVYTNKSGQRVVVNSCARTADAAMVITKTEEGCSVRQDSTAKVSYQKKMATYVMDGAVVIAQACSETGVTYPWVEDRSSCSALVDTASSKAWPQHKYSITLTDGSVQTVADCAPIAEEVTGIIKTRVGCEGLYSHDLTGGQSYGQSRWYYNLGAGAVYVNSCAQDVAYTFPHQTRINGYENNDTTRTAKPKTEIYFLDNGAEVIASAAQVRAGAVDIAYTLSQADVTVATGISTYAGCNAYRETAVSDVYTRPDGTTYTYAKGAGTSTGPVDVCVAAVAKSASYKIGSGAGGCESGPDTWNNVPAYDIYRTVNKIQNTNTENGTVVSSTCSFTGSEWNVSTGTARCLAGNTAWTTYNGFTVPPCPSGF